MKLKNYIMTVAVVMVLLLPTKLNAQTYEIIFVKDISGSASQDLSDFNGKESFLKIVKPLDLMNSKYGVFLTVCTIGETGHPRYYTVELKEKKWSDSKEYRYRSIKVFLSEAYKILKDVQNKENNKSSSSIYRNLNHIVHTGFREDPSKRFLLIWSDYIEQSNLDIWYNKYGDNPSEIIKNYDVIVKNFESDLDWTAKPKNTEVYLISKGYSELSIMSSRWWKQYLSSKGMTSKIKASY